MEFSALWKREQASLFHKFISQIFIFRISTVLPCLLSQVWLSQGVLEL